MRKLDVNKLATLTTANDMLDKKYGAQGTESRTAFDVESQAWYEGQVLGSYRISMPKNLHESLSAFAKAQGISISNVVSNILAKELNVAL